MGNNPNLMFFFSETYHFKGVKGSIVLLANRIGKDVGLSSPSIGSASKGIG